MSVKLTRGKPRDIYITTLHVRNFEEKIAYLFSMGMAHGPTHLCVGEETAGVGACAALKLQDRLETK
jgi:TPP-dependent pyruvate/acetoin dehydrogenase alpha subunit